jgi:hypothetical protein
MLQKLTMSNPSISILSALEQKLSEVLNVSPHYQYSPPCSHNATTNYSVKEAMQSQILIGGRHFMCGYISCHWHQVQEHIHHPEKTVSNYNGILISQT